MRERDDYLDKEFDFSKAVKNPYPRQKNYATKAPQSGVFLLPEKDCAKAHKSAYRSK